MAVTPEYLALEEAKVRKPKELYHFWRADGGGHWRYTSSDTAILFGGELFLPGTIKRTVVKYDAELSVTTMRISGGAIEEPVLEFIAINPIEIYWIMVMKLHEGLVPEEASVVFVGQIKGVSFKGVQADVECVGFEHFLKMPIPKERYQVTCNWQVFDSKCTLNKDDFKATAVITLDVTKTILTSDAFYGGPVRIGVGERAKVASGNLTPIEPVGVNAADILLCFCTQKDNIVSTMGAEWTQIYGVNNGVSMRGSAWWSRRYEAPPNYLITRVGGDTGIAAVVAYRNCIPIGTPIDQFSTHATSPADVVVIANSVTTSLNNCRILFVAHGADDGVSGAFTGINPIPFEILDDNTNLGTDAGLAISDGIQVGLGATLEREAQYSISGLHIGATIAIFNGNSDGYFTGGWVDFVAGNEKRTIVAHVADTITMAWKSVV